jgi:hypothetical protein
MSVQEEAEETTTKLLVELGQKAESYQFLIPGWEPQNLDMAVRWLKSQIWEGFSVQYKIDDVHKVVSLTSWEEC